MSQNFCRGSIYISFEFSCVGRAEVCAYLIQRLSGVSIVWLIVVYMQVYMVYLNNFYISHSRLYGFLLYVDAVESIARVAQRTLRSAKPYLSLLPEICRRNVPNPFAARSDINEISLQNDTSRDDANFSAYIKSEAMRTTLPPTLPSLFDSPIGQCLRGVQ